MGVNVVCLARGNDCSTPTTLCLPAVMIYIACTRDILGTIDLNLCALGPNQSIVKATKGLVLCVWELNCLSGKPCELKISTRFLYVNGGSAGNRGFINIYGFLVLETISTL